jgi:DNA primase
VTLLFDADRAGQQGCWRAIENWAKQACPVSLAVAILPANVKDPDDLVKQQGPEALLQVLDAREPASVAYCRHLVGAVKSNCDLLRAATLAVPFLTAVGVCHPFEVKLATDFLADHGISAAQLRLATQQLDSAELQQMRGALNARIAYIDSLL